MFSQLHPKPDESANSEPRSLFLTGIALQKPIDLEEFATEAPWSEIFRAGYWSAFEFAQGTLYVFSFGAIVCETRAIPEALEALQKHGGCTPLRDTKATFEVTVDSQAASGPPQVSWEKVVIRAGTPQLLGTVALLLGQSAALERYEREVDKLLEEASALPESLMRKGRIPSITKRLLRWSGRVTSYRLDLTSRFFLVDKPDEVWADPQIAALYDALFANLKMRDRYHGLRYKLRAVEQATDRVLGLSHSQTSNRLEWAIVLLIVFDIAYAIFAVGKG